MSRDSLSRTIERNHLRPFFERVGIAPCHERVRIAFNPSRLPGHSLPLLESLGILSRQAGTIEAAGPLLAWGRQALNLSAEEEPTWFARAWWGVQAGRVVQGILRRGRIEEVMSLVIPPDTSCLDLALAKGRGVLLIGAHLGPYAVNWHLLDRLDCEVLNLASARGPLGLGIKTIDVSGEEERKRSLAACLLHLRRNGVVMIAADDRWGSRFKPYPFLSCSMSMSLGAAHLARMAVVPTLWFFSLWDAQRKRIQVIIEDSGLDSGQAVENWEDVWVSAYLQRLAEIILHQPENLGFAGGFWNPGGFPPMS